MKIFDPSMLCNLSSNLKNLFQTFLNLDLHVSCMLIEIDESSLSPQWNRDFSIDSNWPKNEKRGRRDYFPPARYMRYGLNIFSKFDGGDDTWLGMKNSLGE